MPITPRTFPVFYRVSGKEGGDRVAVGQFLVATKHKKIPIWGFFCTVPNNLPKPFIFTPYHRYVSEGTEFGANPNSA